MSNLIYLLALLLCVKYKILPYFIPTNLISPLKLFERCYNFHMSCSLFYFNMVMICKILYVSCVNKDETLIIKK